MKKLSLTAITVLAFFALSSCLSIKVDESTAFAPPKRALGPANNVAELDARKLAQFQPGIDKGAYRLEPDGNGSFLLSRQNDTRNREALMPPPILLSNGFIGEGGARIAWTSYSRPSPAANGTVRQRPLVVHCAGNGGDRYNSGFNYAVKALPWADVLVFDYPGYGDTPGPASAATFEAAGSALTTHIAALAQDRKLVFWGHSLGSFVCSRLAALTAETDGLILETPALNAAAVARAWTPSFARPFVRPTVAPSLASYDVVTSSSQMKGPILVLGAGKDNVLPVRLARQVADGLKSSNANVIYQEFPQAQHMNIPDQPSFTATIANFFRIIESTP